MRTLCIFALLISATNSVALGQGAGLMISEDSYGTDCAVNDRVTSVITLYAVYVYGPPINEISFQLPIPQCASLAYLGESSQFANVIGTAQTGVTVGFGTCESPHVTVLQLTFLGSGLSQDCCLVIPLGHPNATSGKIEAKDCSGNTLLVGGHPGLINPVLGCECTPDMIRPEVSNPHPVNGAQNVALDTELEWDTYDPEHGVSEYTMYFGTQSDPPEIPGRFHQSTYDPGPLSYETTYYWSVVVWWVSGSGISKGPVWSFTTGRNPTPIGNTTWGAIKALYRMPPN
jgi:hypothetical protein